MTVPYAFGNATTSIPLSQLDANFNTPITIGNTAVTLGNTITTINNVTFSNVTISSANVSNTQVVYGGTSGQLISNANMYFNGTGLAVISQNPGGTTGTIRLQDYSSNNGSAWLQWINNAGNAQYGAIGGLTAGGLAFWNGGASENMRLDSSGNFLVGTTSAVGKISTVTGNSGGVGLSVYTADQTSQQFKIGLDTTNGAYLGTYTNAPLRFISNNNECMRISGTSVYLAGTAGPRQINFGVTEVSYAPSSGTTCFINLSDTSGSNGGNYSFVIRGLASNGSAPANLTSFSAAATSVYNGSNTTTWNTTSDKRIKKNIVDSNDGLNKISQIQVRNFEYRTPEEITDFENAENIAIKNDGIQIGVIAQELQEVLPECVYEQKNGLLSLKTDNLIWYAINAIKELKSEVDSLKTQLGAK